MGWVKCVVSGLLLVVVAGLLVAWSGVISVAADQPHDPLTYKLLEFARERSIARAAADIEVPDLSDPDLLLAGGPDYNDMCASCHLKPGQRESDLSLGLYPAPPNLSLASAGQGDGDEVQAARRQFWVIKHGIKASGMPAWGLTHDDQRIWAMVAFMKKMPQLSPAHYQILTARGDDEGHH
ncbi:MAG: cytochrome c [Gammaproteobacteria bacterium]|uniref:c-type cytochrome n=1 Tax=Pseudomaricurvus alcaniphilus TaxID=1166482 RepID=UPI00140DAD25|nr:cytochrome c [Pseudomaricurvus alcaniphilus]MBR9908739.1 cytochrome c [Gammaproteobacteria bacterium]NHN37834.1 cytochrome c [Pseudomaricurvus alcaniphilus]